MTISDPGSNNSLTISDFLYKPQWRYSTHSTIAWLFTTQFIICLTLYVLFHLPEHFMTIFDFETTVWWFPTSTIFNDVMKPFRTYPNNARFYSTYLKKFDDFRLQLYLWTTLSFFSAPTQTIYDKNLILWAFYDVSSTDSLSHGPFDVTWHRLWKYWRFPTIQLRRLFDPNLNVYDYCRLCR